MTVPGRLSTDGSLLTVIETLILARLALNGLPCIDDLSRTYGRFQDHLDDLETDLRAAGGDVNRLLRPVTRRRTTPRRCC
jgi:hypothetical protein